jgi:surface antigen
LGRIQLQTDAARAVRDKLAELNRRQSDTFDALNNHIGGMSVSWAGEIADAIELRFMNRKKYAVNIAEIMDRYIEALSFAVNELEEADRLAAEQMRQEEERASQAAAVAAGGAGVAAVQVNQHMSRDSASFSQSGGNPFERGQCTWYAWGRVNEITGKNINFSQNTGRHAKNWPSLITNSVEKSIPERGFAMVDTTGQFGHVAVVESVESLPNGDYRILFSEANWDGSVYTENPGTDGTVKEILLSQLGNRGFDTILEIT